MQSFALVLLIRGLMGMCLPLSQLRIWFYILVYQSAVFTCRKSVQTYGNSRCRSIKMGHIYLSIKQLKHSQPWSSESVLWCCMRRETETEFWGEGLVPWLALLVWPVIPSELVCPYWENKQTWSHHSALINQSSHRSLCSFISSIILESRGNTSLYRG